MKTRNWMIVLAMSLTSLFVACDKDDDTDQNQSLEQSDIDYLNKIAQGNLAEISWSKIAQDSATNTRVLQFAQQMITEHQQSQTQLDSLARSYNVNLNTTLDTSYARWGDSLRAQIKGRNFDTLFMGQQVRHHDSMINVLTATFTNAKNNNVITWSGNQLQNVTRHRDSANVIKNAL